MKSTESPATSLLALIKTLHPVVRRCLLGWPAKRKETNITNLHGEMKPLLKYVFAEYSTMSTIHNDKQNTSKVPGKFSNESH